MSAENRRILAAEIAALALFAFCARNARAEQAPLSVNSPEAYVLFGSPALFPDPPRQQAPARARVQASPQGADKRQAQDATQGPANGGETWYLQTGAVLSASGGAVKSAGEGVVLFVQKKSSLSGGFPRASGDFVAIGHKGGFVSVYSGKSFSPDPGLRPTVAAGGSIGTVAVPQGAQDGQYSLRVYDGAANLWVNPAIFLNEMSDLVAPKISQVILAGKDRSFSAQNDGKNPQRIGQGDYILGALVSDPSGTKGPVSGIFRLKAVLNGNVVADKKFDSARSTQKGLAFLDLEAPSSTVVDEEGRLLLGSQFIPRGQNTLEFTVFDYCGNSSSITWKFVTD